MSWSEALWWLPTAAVLAMTGLGFAAVAAQADGPRRKYWLAALVFAGAVAIGASVWQQKATRAALGGTAEQLNAMRLRLDEIGGLLPGGPGATAGATFDTVAASIRSLNTRIEELENQVRALREKTRSRGIEPAAAAKTAEYLRQVGSQRVVVSCVPDDMEAFNYANQIANLLREAGWEALGPEKTTIFGEAPAMGVRLFVRSGVMAPDAARILIEAFTRFNIPFQSGIAPSDAIPDPMTTELFVSHKP
jgi:outer membrane murein-binding lipoprotein Lpp